MSEVAAAPNITIASALAKGTQVLAHAGSDSAQLDCQLLLADVMQVGRTQLFGLNDRALTEQEVQRFRLHLARRSKLEPIAYILGRREFFHSEFLVNADVLIPRPETELLVETALQWIRDEKGLDPVRILEIGTGSGAIAISLMLQLDNVEIVATDISAKALAVAKQNAERLLGTEQRAHLSWLEMDGVAPLIGKQTFDLIVTNPPYIARSQVAELPPQVKDFEPVTALVGGESGLEMLQAILAAFNSLSNTPGVLIFECGKDQAANLLPIMQGVSPHHAFRRDLAGIERCGIVWKGS